MLHELPITNVRLLACPESWQQMTPTARGRHCQSCQREVIDFTQATLPELLWAKTGAADGHLCGRFRTGQLAAPPAPRPRPRLRWFLAAAVLVVLQGLSAQQAVAQVGRHAAVVRPTSSRQPARPHPTKRTPARRRTIKLVPAEPGPVELLPLEVLGGLPMDIPAVELYPGMDLELVLAYVRRSLQYPTVGRSTAEVLVRFRVDATGRVQDAAVERSAGPAFDTEALRVVRGLPALAPPQGLSPLGISVSLPIYFQPQ